MPLSAEKRLTNNVVKRINELCKEHGWTQHKLAVQSGLKAATVHYLMNGTRQSVNLATVQKIAHGCGLSVFEFFDRPYFKTKPKETPPTGPL